jgi:hypothetical protein
MGHRFSISIALTSALALGACEQTKCDPPVDTKATPIVAETGPKPCGEIFEVPVSFTGAQAKDRLVVEPLGPDCANPAVFARLYDGSGRLVYANMTSGKWLMNAEMFPQAGGTPSGVAKTLYDIGEPNSLTLPQWKAGARSPSRGNYGAFEPLVPQAAYERLRALNAPTLIKRGGAESGTFYIYDPESGEAVAIAQFAV